VCCSVLHCAAVCCSVLQCVADCCRLLQCVTAHTLRAFLLFSLSAKRPKSCCVSSWSPIMSILRSILREIILGMWLDYGGVMLRGRLDYTLDLFEVVIFLFDTDSFNTTSCVTQLSATHYNTLKVQFSTTSCDTVHTAKYCNTLQHQDPVLCVSAQISFAPRNTLQHSATHCNIREKRTAPHCNTSPRLIQHTATHNHSYQAQISPATRALRLYIDQHCTLQHTATHYNIREERTVARCHTLPHFTWFDPTPFTTMQHTVTPHLV